MTIQANFPAIKPSLLLDFANTKQLDPRITYTRASTATFYNGVTTAMAEQNLLTYSQEFDNAGWVKSATTVTANTIAAPDGTTTADSMFETTATSGHNLGQTITTINGSTYTFSAYVKANGRNFCALYIGGTNKGKFFDITAGGGGSVGGDLIGAPTSAALTYVGNDWYRVSITAVVTASSAVQIYSCDTISTFSFTGDVTKGLYLWGAQLENRSSATAYTATTTQAITNYIPVLQTAASGVARFDNNPTTGESLGLLIEESRTNLILQSYDFTTTWTTTNATVTANTVVAPDGTLTGDSIINTATSNQHYALQNVSIAANATYTTSVYLKALGTTTVATIWLLNAATADRALVSFTFATGVVSSSSAGGAPFTSVSATATSVGNGWSRITLTATSTGGAINLQTRIFPNDASTFTGDAYSGVFAWGAQLEAGAFATSYIPTVASQVTRAADAASMTGTNFSSWYSINGGSLYSSYRIAFTSGTRYLLSIDQNIQNYVELAGNGTTNRTLLVNRSGNTLDVNITGTSAVSLTSLNQVAIAVANNDFALYLNGASQGSDTSATLAPTLASLEIGRYNEGSPGGYLNGTIAKIAYYPLRVTNAQLQALTS